MGLCISRRAMQAAGDHPHHEEASTSAAGGGGAEASNLGKSSNSEVDLINPARLLLESPRISTDISDMGMFGLLFHKRYCCKSQPQPSSSKQHPNGYQKLHHHSPNEAEDNSSEHPGEPRMQQNALFEEELQHQQEADEELLEDGYPTFQPNSIPPQRQQESSTKAPEPAKESKMPQEDRDKGIKMAEADATQEQEEQHHSNNRAMWQSAGEEFFSDWEDRSATSAAGTRATASMATTELAVFEAEEYFKEDSVHGKEEEATISINEGAETGAAAKRAATQSSTDGNNSIVHPPRVSACSSASSSGGGIRWAALCTGATAVEIDEHVAATSSSSGAGGARKKSKTKAEMQISKMFKLLASPSSNSAASSSAASKVSPAASLKLKKARIAETQVKEWMDRARKSLDDATTAAAVADHLQQQQGAQEHRSRAERKATKPQFSSASTAAVPVPAVASTPVIATAQVHKAQNSVEDGKKNYQQAFGSPFPSSPSKQVPPAASSIKPGHEDDEDQGNESDSSSDLFELDSVTTSLSSARSSLSRLSSARSSVRKSTVDEADMLHFISDSKPVPPKTLSEITTIAAASNEDVVEFQAKVLPTTAASAQPAAVLIMKNRRHRLSCIDSATPILSSIVEESKISNPTGSGSASNGRRRPAPTSSKTLNTWSSSSNSVLAVQT